MRPHSTTLCLLGAMLAFHAFSVRAETTPPLLPDPAAHTVWVPFDESKSVKDQKPQHYYLDRQEFDKLWALAKENRKAEMVVDKDDAAPSATLHSALYRATLLDQGIGIEAVYSVAARGHWSKAMLGLKEGDAHLPAREVKVNGKPGSIVNGEITFEQPGTHTVQLTFDLVRPAHWKQAAVNLPAARAALLTLALPDEDAMPVFGNKSLIAVEEVINGVRTITTGLGSATELTLERVQRRAISDALPPSADVIVSTSLSGELRLHSTVQARFVFPGSARKEVALELDPAWTLDGVPEVKSAGGKIGGVRMSLREEAGKPVLVAAFAQGVSDEVTLDLHLTPKAMSTSSTPLAVPRAARWESLARLIAQDGVQITARPTPAQARIDNDTYDHQGQKIPVQRYRLGARDTLAFDMRPADSKTSAQVDYVYQLSEQKQEMAAAIKLTRERGAWRQIKLGLPAGMELQSVQSPLLSAWEQQGSQLYLRFHDSTGQDARIVVYVANAALQPTKVWTLQPLAMEGLGKVKGTALIAAHAAVEARLEGFQQAPDLREIDASAPAQTFNIRTPLEKKRAIKFERADWSLKVSVQEQPARFVADSVMLAQATDGGMLLSQQIALSVEAGALKRVVVRLPAALPEATVSGELLREVNSKVVDAVREYECTFQSQGGLLGRTAMTFDMQLPMTDAEVAVPYVEVVDAERLRRFFVLDNSSSREPTLVQSDGVDICTKDALPYLPDVVTQPKYYQGRPTGGLKLAFKQLQASSGNAAIVTLADITTVLRPDGERWDTVVYSLSNRSLQFLPVILPDKAELIAVSVSGEAVRADEELRDKRRVRLIPLIQTRAGERSMEVRLIYRIKGGDLPRQVKLDDPELPGLSAERTVWTASLPRGWTVADTTQDIFGNMEIIEEEGRDLEKLQSWMSDLGRLNRVLSSSNDVYENKLALAEAEKLKFMCVQLAEKVEGRRSKDRYSLYFNEGKPNPVLEKLVRQTEVDLGNARQELTKQNDALDNNRGKVFKEEAQKNSVALTKLGAGTLVLNGNGRANNSWSFNYAAPAQQDQAAKTAPQAQSVPYVDLNDNVGVSQEFFQGMRLAGANTYTGVTYITGGKLNVVGQTPLEITAGGTTLTVGGNSTLTGNVTAGGANFAVTSNARATAMPQYNGGVMDINGGTLSISNSTVAEPQAATATATRDAFGASAMPATGLRFDAAAMVPDLIDGLLKDSRGNAPAAMPAGWADQPNNLARRQVLIPPPTSPAAVNQVNDQIQSAAKGPAPSQSIAWMSQSGGAPMYKAENTGLTTASVNQLRPTGRRSLNVEVPLTNQVFHFRKLKDHAVLALDLKQERPEGWTARAAFTGIGLAVWGLFAFLARRRSQLSKPDTING